MRTVAVLLVVAFLLLISAGSLLADAVYLLQGVVKNPEGIGVDDASYQVNCSYYDQTFTSSISTCGPQYPPGGGSGPGVYRVESDLPDLQKCGWNNIRAEKNIGRTWYRGGVRCTWTGAEILGCPCGRRDFTIYPNGAWPNCNEVCVDR
jgi:hypothetical protein